MSEQLLTPDRLAAISHSRCSKIFQSSIAVVSEVKEIDRDDYRSFVIERREPVSQVKGKVLAQWLTHRKDALAKIA